MFRYTSLNAEKVGQNFKKKTWKHDFDSVPKQNRTQSAVNKVTALQYNIIISKEKILWEELNNLPRIPLAPAYPLHLIIKNIKKSSFTPTATYSQLILNTETNIFPIIPPFSEIGKSFTTTINKNWHTIAYDATLRTTSSSTPLSAFRKSSSIHNHLLHSTQTYGLSQQNS